MFRYFILFFVSATCAWAGTASFSIESASNYALRHNPDLAAARLRIEEARGRLRQSGRLRNPEFEFEFRRNVRSREDSKAVLLTQKFPVTARLRKEKALSAAQLAAAEAEIENAERKLLSEVQSAAIRLLSLRERRALTEQQIANSQELSGFLLKRVESGEASVVDASQGELETQQLNAELLQLDAERVGILAELRPLLGIGGTIDIDGALPLPGVSGSSRSGKERSDLRAARHQAEAARQEVALARANRWEDVGIGLLAETARSEDAPEGLERDTMLGLKLSMALPLWNLNQGRIDETAAAALRARGEVAALTARIAAESSGARAEVNILARVVTQLDDKLLPKAAQIEKLLRDAYAIGQSSLPEVLRARARLLQLKRQRADVLRSYHLARVRQATATGSILTSFTGAQDRSGK